MRVKGLGDELMSNAGMQVQEVFLLGNHREKSLWSIFKFIIIRWVSLIL